MDLCLYVDVYAIDICCNNVLHIIIAISNCTGLLNSLKYLTASSNSIDDYYIHPKNDHLLSHNTGKM